MIQVRLEPSSDAKRTRISVDSLIVNVNLALQCRMIMTLQTDRHRLLGDKTNTDGRAVHGAHVRTLACCL